MEILPVNDLDVALHNFVNKDDKMAFYSCVQYNLEETRVSIYLMPPNICEKIIDYLELIFDILVQAFLNWGLLSLKKLFFVHLTLT